MNGKLASGINELRLICKLEFLSLPTSGRGGEYAVETLHWRVSNEVYPMDSMQWIVFNE